MNSAPARAAPIGRISVEDLTKVFGGRIRAVDSLSFSVEPGSVTGFLGPNGAGKTTTLRMILGLVHPTSGRASIDGQEYRHLPDPLRTIGAALESTGFHPARTGRNHLLLSCRAVGLPDRRADEVLGLVGLGDAGKRKVRGYSLGMRQRLALATALLGDPRVLIMDEPTNGLDPDGIRWMRGFFRFLADQGRTVLVSSHLLGEVQESADRAVILHRGRLVRAGSIRELTAGTDFVIVRTPQPQELADVLAAQRAGVEPFGPGLLRVRGASAEQVGHLAFANRIELHELSPRRADLSELFFALTADQAPGRWGPPPPGWAPSQPVDQERIPR